jgi:hypothetical protein
MGGVVRNLVTGVLGMDDGSAARAQAAKQAEQLSKQEAAVNQQQSELAQKTMAGIKARRGGGLASLLSGERQDELGVQSKLGGM